MTLKDLLTQHGFAEIRQPFMRLWQTNEPKSAARLDLGNWERIYRKVQALEPVPSDYYIGLVSRWEHCSPRKGRRPARRPRGLPPVMAGNRRHGGNVA